MARDHIHYENTMPLRWYGNGDPTDPIYLHYSRIVNFTIHFMAFAALNTGLWLAEQIRHDLPQLKFFTAIWIVGLVSHLIFVLLKRPSDSQNSLLSKE